jgi:bacterioferritin (cytochrome b1)
MWENLRLQAVERQAKLHERLMSLQTEQLNQMDAWLTHAETRIQAIHQLADSLGDLTEQKNELAHLQDDLVKEQEAVDCLKQIIVVVDDNTDDQAFTDLENKLSSLSDRWSNVCKFVGNRWFTVQDLIIKLQSIETDYTDLNDWISNKSLQLNNLIKKARPLVIKNKMNIVEKFSTIKEEDEDNSLVAETNTQVESNAENEYGSIELTSSTQLIKILKDVESEMQSMHAKLNDMNDIGEQIGTQLNNSPTLTNSINVKMDTLETKWNSLLEQMEYLSKVCTEQQQIELAKSSSSSSSHGSPTMNATQPLSPQSVITSESTKTQLILQAGQLSEYQSIDPFVTQLNTVLSKITLLINPESSNLSQMNPDEQQEIFKKADAEIKQNEDVLESMQAIAANLIGSGQVTKDASELESLVSGMLVKWEETKRYVNQLAVTLEKSCVSRRATDELVELRDVHEGYQRYIADAESLSSDAQKLNLQLETNKVRIVFSFCSALMVNIGSESIHPAYN